MKNLTVTVLDFHEFDKLVVDNLWRGINGNYRLGTEFSCVALEEWGNDEDHLFEIEKSNADGDYYKEYSLPDVEKFISTRSYTGFRPSVYTLLTYMCCKDIIPEGNYLIRVSW